MSENKTCLVVDDSEVIREITVRIIKDMGFNAVQAVNAAEAVECCKDIKPDVVLLDWDLPSMGALDFLRGANEITESERPTIILCATENDPQQFTLARAAGAAHHILKPFDKAMIEAKFAEIGLIDAGQPVQERASNQ